MVDPTRTRWGADALRVVADVDELGQLLMIFLHGHPGLVLRTSQTALPERPMLSRTLQWLRTEAGQRAIDLRSTSRA